MTCHLTIDTMQDGLPDLDHFHSGHAGGILLLDGGLPASCIELVSDNLCELLVEFINDVHSVWRA